MISNIVKYVPHNKSFGPYILSNVFKKLGLRLSFFAFINSSNHKLKEQLKIKILFFLSKVHKENNYLLF